MMSKAGSASARVGVAPPATLPIRLFKSGPIGPFGSGMPPLMLPAPASGRRGRFGELQEAVQQRVALLRGDALRMELHAVDRQGPVLQAHDHRSEERRVGKEWVSTCRYRW